MMKNKLFIVFIILFFIGHGKAQAQDVKIPEANKNKYSIAASNENTVLLDNQSGETWIMVKKPGAAQPYEWVKMKSAFEPEVKAGDWASIVQGQNRPMVKTDRSATSVQNKNELRVTQQKIDQLKVQIKAIEQKEQEINKEIAEQMAEQSKQSADSAREALKKILELMKEMNEMQKQAVKAMSSL